MNQNGQNSGPDHNAAEETVQNYIWGAITTVFYVVLSITGLLILASSFDRSSIFLLVLSFLLGLGIITISGKYFYSLYK